MQDDLYDGPTNYDQWTRNGSTAQVDWTWGERRTDGGVFSGLEGELGLELTITPAFNEDATLYRQYYTGTVRRWQVLTGLLDAPERHDLLLDEPVTISRGACVGGSVSVPPSDDDDDRPGEGRGRDDRPSDRGNGNGREQSDGNARGRERSNGRRRGKDDDDNDDNDDNDDIAEIEVGDDDDDDGDDDDDDDDIVEVEIGDDDDDDEEEEEEEEEEDDD